MHELVNRLSGAAVLSVLLCSTVAWLLLGIPASGINDADIYLVYAQNFLNGHGIVCNVGDAQHEGFPSLLWMLLCSFFYLFSHVPEVPLLLLNLLIGSITVYLCLKRSNRKIVFLVLLCAAPAWFAWCQLTLVESGLWCLLLTASILDVSERNTHRLTWLLPLLALTRPESMLWGCWLLLALLLGLGLDRGWRAGLRAGFRPLFAFGITWALLMLFRGLYFGSVLPVHDRGIDLSAGFIYWLGWLLSNPAVLPVFLVFGWVCVREIVRKRGLSKALAVCICLLPGLCIPLVAGDEPFRGFRLYQPAWPLLCLVAAWAMPLLYAKLGRPVRLSAAAALMLGGWTIFALSPNLRDEFRMSRQGRDQGSVMARMFEGHEPLPGVGAMAAGGCKVVYPGKVYDLQALTTVQNELIPAEARGFESPLTFDHEAFYAWSPDILIPGGRHSTSLRLFRKLQSEPQFRKCYSKGELWYNREVLSGYFSRDFINRLEEGHYAFTPDLLYTMNLETPPTGTGDPSGGALVSDSSPHSPDPDPRAL